MVRYSGGGPSPLPGSHGLSRRSPLYVYPVVSSSRRFRSLPSCHPVVLSARRPFLVQYATGHATGGPKRPRNGLVLHRAHGLTRHDAWNVPEKRSLTVLELETLEFIVTGFASEASICKSVEVQKPRPS